MVLIAAASIVMEAITIQQESGCVHDVFLLAEHRLDD
jgi:hypothetical protein